MHYFSIGHPPHFAEVCRLAAGVVNHIQCEHAGSGSISDHADISAQGHIVDMPGSGHFFRLTFNPPVQFLLLSFKLGKEIQMPVSRFVVQNHLGIKSNQPVWCYSQRVDFNKSGVIFIKDLPHLADKGCQRL